MINANQKENEMTDQIICPRCQSDDITEVNEKKRDYYCMACERHFTLPMSHPLAYKVVPFHDLLPKAKGAPKRTLAQEDRAFANPFASLGTDDIHGLYVVNFTTPDHPRRHRFAVMIARSRKQARELFLMGHDTKNCHVHSIEICCRNKYFGTR